MPDYDTCHHQVVNALQKAGWTVDSNQLHITDTIGNDFYIDLTAIRPAGEPGALEIAVEVKCFGLPKKTAELHRAIGQCILYAGIAAREGYTLPVYMAVPSATYKVYFNDALLAVLLSHGLKFVKIDLDKEELVEWIE